MLKISLKQAGKHVFFIFFFHMIYPNSLFNPFNDIVTSSSFSLPHTLGPFPPDDSIAFSYSKNLYQDTLNSYGNIYIHMYIEITPEELELYSTFR